MDRNDALFTTLLPVTLRCVFVVHEVPDGASEPWIQFHSERGEICRRMLRSAKDEVSAKSVFSAAVHLHAAAIEEDDGDILIALLAQVGSPPEAVFLPEYPGVAAIGRSKTRFFPLGDIHISTGDRQHPDDFLNEVRHILEQRIGHRFTSDAERQIEQLLRSL